MPLKKRGAPRFQTTLYDPCKSYINVSFRPNEATPMHLYVLLHELGHIGYTNYLTGLSSSLAALQVPAAIAPIFLFASFSSWWMYVLAAFVVIPFTVQSLTSGRRIEAEIEADHFALFQLMLFARGAGPFSKAASEMIGGNSLFIVDDKRLYDEGNWLRKQIFDRMLDDMRRNKLRRVDYYLWLASGLHDFQMIIFNVALLAALASVIKFQMVDFSWLSITAAFVVCLLLYVLVVAGKTMNLSSIKAAIEDKDPAAKDPFIESLTREITDKIMANLGAIKTDFHEKDTATPNSLEFLKHEIADKILDAVEARAKSAPFGLSRLEPEPSFSVNGKSEARHYELLLPVFRKSANAEPGSLERQRYLAGVLGLTGDAWLHEDQVVTAVQYYHESLQLRRELARACVGDADIQWELSAAYHRLGHVMERLGDFQNTLKNHRKGLKIARKLTHQGSANILWRRMLILSHVKVALAAELLERFKERHNHLEAALRISRELKQFNQIDSDFLLSPDKLEALLEQFSPETAYRKAIRLFRFAVGFLTMTVRVWGLHLFSIVTLPLRLASIPAEMLKVTRQNRLDNAAIRERRAALGPVTRMPRATSTATSHGP